jgi:hypothetical protein
MYREAVVMETPAARATSFKLGRLLRTGTIATWTFSYLDKRFTKALPKLRKRFTKPLYKGSEPKNCQAQKIYYLNSSFSMIGGTWTSTISSGLFFVPFRFPLTLKRCTPI